MNLLGTWRRRLSVLAVFGLLVGAAVATPFALFVTTAVAPADTQIIVIPPGAPFLRVARQLEETGIITNSRYFALLARLKQSAGSIRSGDYMFRESATPSRILERLLKGDVHQYPLTIPEGLTLEEIAARVEDKGLGNAGHFLAAARNPQLLEELNIEADSAEGYLFPETYLIPKGYGESRLIRRMVAEFKRRLPAGFEETAKQRNLSLHQLVTLASIVQKEVARVDEMPLVSAVFHNRLRIGMRLQSCPTVIYGLDEFDGNLTRKHLETYTPYNTYRFGGLPPGPISNPGSNALQAAANPAEVNYIYFVARGDGSHVYSTNLRDHNAAVRRYQLKR